MCGASPFGIDVGLAFNMVPELRRRFRFSETGEVAEYLPDGDAPRVSLLLDPAFDEWWQENRTAPEGVVLPGDLILSLQVVPAGTPGAPRVDPYEQITLDAQETVDDGDAAEAERIVTEYLDRVVSRATWSGRRTAPRW